MDENYISIQIVNAGSGVCERCGTQTDQLCLVTFQQGRRANSYELCRRCTVAANRFAERCRREAAAESAEEPVTPPEEPVAPPEEPITPPEEPVAPPEEPVAPPEEPVATPEEPVAPPEEPVAPPEEPVAPPEEPVAPPEEPVAPPEEPVAPPEEPVTPPEEPVTPPEEPITPPEEPITPPEEPITPPEEPITPPEEPVTPPEEPVTPPEEPVTPPEAPVAPPEAPVAPLEMSTAPQEEKLTPPEAPVAPPEAPADPLEAQIPSLEEIFTLPEVPNAPQQAPAETKEYPLDPEDFPDVFVKEFAKPAPKKSSGCKTTAVLFVLFVIALIAAVALAVALNREPAEEKTTAAPTATTAAPATAAPTTAPEPEDEDVDDSLIKKLSSVLIVDDAGYEYYNFNKPTADRYAAAVSRTADSLKGTARVFDIVVPTSMDITLSNRVRKRITNTEDQKKAIDYIYAAVSENAVKVNAFDTLRAHRKEYVYFRTDHHWTALGAYYAYREYAAAAGLRAAELEEFTERKFENFVGAFYNDSGKNKALEKNPDVIYAYEPKMTNKMTYTDKRGKEFSWNIITDVSTWSRSSRYNTFIGGDQPYAYINYPKEGDWSTCVVVKESFGNAFVPFLLANYNEIHVIDYRYWNGKLADFVRSTGAKDVIFLNNISATRNSVLVKWLDAIS